MSQISVVNQLDYLLPTKASLDIIGANGFSINVQTFKIPTLFGYVAEHATPMAMRPLPGNKLVYNVLEASFLVSENLQSWIELHDWMRGCFAPEKTEEFKTKKLYLEEMVLTTYTSANNPLMRFRFHDAFPARLDEIAFDMQTPTGDPVKSRVEFAFLRYDVEKVS
jgi:hypothetical protein